MTDDVTHLRALLADATARAEKAEAERDAALAACAEMRAALTEIIARGQEQRGTGRMIETAEAALARPDLGRGMVVEREVLERSGGRIKAALDDIYETWVNADEGGARTCDEATVGALKAVLVDLDALLKKCGE